MDPGLREYAKTDRERESLDALAEHGSTRKAAAALQCAKGTLDAAVERVRKRAAQQGYSPAHDQTHPVPDGQTLRGVSTLYGPEGEVKAQWVKSATDKERREQILLAAMQDALTDFRGKSVRVSAPKKRRSDVLTAYPIADLHLGAYAYGPEAGEDYDSDVAESLLRSAIDRLVDTAPESDEALVIDLGDLVHTDDDRNQTKRSGNALDVDTRWQRIVTVAIKLLVYCIERAKAKHRIVRFRKVFGNHDETTSQMLTVGLALYYENDKRVIIEDTPAAFWYYRFGKVMLGATHGDRTKGNQLPGIMAADRPEDWGASRHRYWLTGHLHHSHVQEYPGCIVEIFRTLAARDAYHAHAGYRAGRDMCSIIYHAEHGEIERHRIDVGMLREVAA